MPALPMIFSKLVGEAPLPLDDFSAQPLQTLTRTDLLAVARQAADLLGSGAGTLLVELGVPRAQLRAPLRRDDLGASPAFRAVREGGKTVARGEPDRVLAQLVQRALQAVGARSDGPRALTLPRWGADGSFGDEAIAAVRAFQTWCGLPLTGVIAAAEARQLEARLHRATVPDPLGADHPVSVLSAGAQRVVAIAQAIVASTEAAPFSRRVDGVTYRCHARQFGVAVSPGVLRMPGGVGYGLATTPYWKCNLFGGSVIALADLPVPTFEAGRYRHFPRAERFGDALAHKTGWRLLTHLDHRDPADPNRATVSDANDAAIAALLRAMRPGDLFFVDHPGVPGDDGGHTRVCTRAAAGDTDDPAPLFAQARLDAAREERDSLTELSRGHETQFWHLRTTL